MFTIVICDDDSDSKEEIERLVSSYISDRKQQNVEVKAYTEPNLVVFPKNDCLYLLDIVMPKRTGLELCKNIMRVSPNSRVIFCTSSKEFAIDAFNLRATHYLLKPIDSEKLYLVLDEVLESCNSANNICVTTNNGDIRILERDIIYMEYFNHRILINLSTGQQIQTVSSRKPFGELIDEMINWHNFIRPHQSFVVNLNHIQKFNPIELTLSGGQIVPIAKNRRTEIREQYISHLSMRSERGGA